MWKTAEGSTARLVQLCFFYFLFYVVTGVTVKYFQDALPGRPAIMSSLEFLVYSTVGGNAICLGVVLARGWWRIRSNKLVGLGPWQIPLELFYIVPSGVCTAVVILTTTLMYSLKGVSVMVAMVIMRASVMVISRVVDFVQIRMGILERKVYRIEDLAIVFALGVVAVEIKYGKSGAGQTSFLQSPEALTTFTAYIVAYAFRIFIMNYYKNTRGKGVKLDNEGFFGIEQVAATITIFATGAVLMLLLPRLGVVDPRLEVLRGAVVNPKPQWPGAILAGTAFGMVAFFSVFIFMFKGRTATFAGLVNRLTSLVAGTTATVILWLVWGAKTPELKDWFSLGLILCSVACLTLAERRRARELAAEAMPPPAEAPKA